MTDHLHTFDDIAPAWEANYEPGNVSDYLIGYANSEAAAKGAALAWLQSQSDADPTTLEWVEQPTGDRYDHWYGLIRNADDGMVLDLGINVRHRLAAARTAARQTTGHDDTGAACSLPGFAGCECNHLTGCEHPAPAVGQPDGTCTEDFRRPRCHPHHTADCPYTDPTTADGPTPLRWGLGDVLHGDDDTVTVCLSGPDRQFLDFALGLAADAMASGDGFTDADETALARLRRIAYGTTQPAEAHDTDTSMRNVIEHALTVYYQDSSAPSAIARAILAQHRSETLSEAAETFRTEAAETATAAQENYDPDMAREAKRLNAMANHLDRMADGSQP